jgi:hypothetical protein
VLHVLSEIAIVLKRDEEGGREEESGHCALIKEGHQTVQEPVKSI